MTATLVPLFNSSINVASFPSSCGDAEIESFCGDDGIVVATVVVAGETFAIVVVCDAPDVTIVACMVDPVPFKFFCVIKESDSVTRRTANGGAGTTNDPFNIVALADDCRLLRN